MVRAVYFFGYGRFGHPSARLKKIMCRIYEDEMGYASVLTPSLF